MDVDVFDGDRDAGIFPLGLDHDMQIRELSNRGKGARGHFPGKRNLFAIGIRRQ